MRKKKSFKNIFTMLMSIVLLLSLSTDIYAFGNGNEEDISQSRQSAFERILSGFESFEEKIDLSEFDLTPNELSRLFMNVTKNNPYLFYVDNNLSYTYHNGGYIVEIMPKYNRTKEEAEKMIEDCRREIKKLADIALLGEGEIERAGLAHDLICLRYKYDLTLESKDIYTFLSSGTGTCQGYTWAYMALLREIGIECEYVASDDIVHIWLKVKVDGEWYHSDVTWDDPPSGEGSGGGVSRRHFLFSDKKADSDGYSERYGASENQCTSEKYDMTEFSPCSRSCDIDHSGKLTLSELVALRIYIETGEKKGKICPLCADCDRNLKLDETDIKYLREMLLREP